MDKLASSRRESSLWLLIPLIAFPQIAETIYTPSLPDMARAFLTSTRWVNLSLSVYFCGFALGVFFFGSLCDRMGRRPAMMLGLLLYTLASGCCTFAPSIGFLLAFRIIQGIGASVGSVVSTTIMRDLYTGTRRSQVFSIVSAVLALSPAVGPLLGGLIDEYFGFRANLGALFGLGFILLVASSKFLNESQSLESTDLQEKSGVFSVMKRMICDAFIWKTVVVISVCNGILFSFYGEAPHIFQGVLGYSPSEYGRIGFAVALSSVIGAVLSHRLVKKFSSTFIVNLGVLLTVLGSFVFLGTASFGWIRAESGIGALVAIMFPMFFILVGFGLIIPNTLSVALKSYQDQLGFAGACLGLMYYAIIALLTDGISLLHDGSVLVMPRYFVVISLAMFLVTLVPSSLQSIRANHQETAA